MSRPKIALQDTGLAARLVNVAAAGAAPDTDAQLAGPLLEGFIAGECLAQMRDRLGDRFVNGIICTREPRPYPSDHG